MLRKERKEIHAAIGDAIERVYADQIDKYVELLARHYSWSVNLEQALHYLILAGQKASREHINSQARKHYELALEILPDIEPDQSQKLDIYIGLADVLLFIGDYEDARKYYLEALEVTEQEPEREEFQETKGSVYRKIGATYERQGDFHEALSHLEKAQQVFSTIDAKLIISERARIQNDIGWIHFRLGELEQAEIFLRKALDLVEGTSHYSVVASILNRLGGVYYQEDDLDHASNFVRKSLVLREEIGDITEVARSYNNLGLLNWKQGIWDRALENFERSVELNESLGDVEAIVLLHNNMGLLQTDRGELGKAKDHLDEGLELACQIGHSALEGETCLHFSRYWLAVEDWEKSLDYSQRSIQICREIGAQENLVDAYWCNGEAWLGKEELNKAAEAGEMAFTLLDKAKITPNVPLAEKGRIFRLLGTISLKRGKINQANTRLKQSSEQFSLLDNQLELGRTALTLAQLSKAQGDKIGARLQENEARLIFQKLGAQLDLEKLDKN